MAITYAEFQASELYQEKFSGSHIDVQIVNEVNFADVIVGAASGLNYSENYEALTVEEVGEDGANEIVQGRYDGSVSVPAFWTPRWNDTAPTRQTFIGKKYTVIERVGAKRVGEGVILNVYTGCILRGANRQFSARGLVTFDFAFVFLRRYTGEEWSKL